MAEVALFAGDRFYRSQFNTGQASYTIFQKDGVVYADPGYPGGTPYSGTDVGAVVNSCITNLASSSAGTGVILARGIVQTVTTGIILNLAPEGRLIFDADCNITWNGTGDFIKITASSSIVEFLGTFKFNATNQIMFHLNNVQNCYCRAFRVLSNSGSILSGTKVVYLDGATAYYNEFWLDTFSQVDIGIHFPFVTVGANANNVLFASFGTVNYGIKIDNQARNNWLGDIQIQTGGANTAGVYIDGQSNWVGKLYGEYAGGGPVLFLDTHASNNRVSYLRQEGAGTELTNNANAAYNDIHLTRPYGFTIVTPAVPATTVAQFNTFPFPVKIYFLTTGTVTVVKITDATGAFQSINTAITVPMELILESGYQITLTFTAAPTWKWCGM